MIIIITGPTGSGKTNISIRLAELLNAEIINCDSRQIYKRMNIGTAKPGPNQMQRVKHHLFDLVAPDEYFNISMYIEMARQIVNEGLMKGIKYIMVGGSGFYIKGFIYGLSPLPNIDADIKQLTLRKMESRDNCSLWNEAMALDPLFTANISKNDRYRLKRFFEIYYTLGKPVSDYFMNNPPIPLDMPYIVFYVDIDRNELYQRIERRADSMIEEGLIEEVEYLKGLGYDLRFPSMNAIGYREVLEMLENDGTLKETVVNIKKNTRHFAKRQIIWFRKMYEKHKIKSLEDIKQILSKNMEKFYDIKA